MMTLCSCIMQKCKGYKIAIQLVQVCTLVTYRVATCYERVYIHTRSVGQRCKCDLKVVCEASLLNGSLCKILEEGRVMLYFSFVLLEMKVQVCSKDHNNCHKCNGRHVFLIA